MADTPASPAPAKPAGRVIPAPTTPATQRVAPEGVRVIDTRTEKLPIAGQRNILITSALPYVNNIPHLGNIIGSTLSADVFSRYVRLRGYNSIYICGTDEYGTATETKALEEGVSCQALCDKYHSLHAQAYKWFEIDFDYFGRTTTPQQTEIAQDIFLKLHKNNCLLKDSMEQLLCETCNRFLADRYVEGTCPSCSYADARGDQCDSCGKLLNAIELVNPKCKVCRNAPVIRSSSHMFLDLPQLQAACEEFVQTSSEKGKWTSNGKVITKSWLKEGLKPRCITRDLKWGTPVPLEEMKEKVFYVWFDAPIGYLSITANYTKSWEAWWKNPDNVELFQFMGKDNVPFHTVIFPCSLIGTKDPYTLLHHVSTTEYLNYEGTKFSKSRNIGVFGNNVVDTGIPASVWRYYLLCARPETADSMFTWDDFAIRNNSELLAVFGNFVNRVLKFAKAKYHSRVPKITETKLEKDLKESVNALLVEYHAAMELASLRAGVRAFINIANLGNKYLTDNKFDNTLFEEKPDVCDTLIAVCIELSYLLAAVSEPFMPSTSTDIYRQLNLPPRALPEKWEFVIGEDHALGEPQHLFRRILEAEIKELKQRFGGASAAAEAQPDPKAAGKKSKAKPSKDKAATPATPASTTAEASPSDTTKA